MSEFSENLVLLFFYWEEENLFSKKIGKKSIFFEKWENQEKKIKGKF